MLELWWILNNHCVLIQLSCFVWSLCLASVNGVFLPVKKDVLLLSARRPYNTFIFICLFLCRHQWRCMLHQLLLVLEEIMLLVLHSGDNSVCCPVWVKAIILINDRWRERVMQLNAIKWHRRNKWHNFKAVYPCCVADNITLKSKQQNILFPPLI